MRWKIIFKKIMEQATTETGIFYIMMDILHMWITLSLLNFNQKNKRKK